MKSAKPLLLKPVLSPGLPFLMNYTSGSNWYIYFSFHIIIYGFVCQTPFTTIDTATVRSSCPVVFCEKDIPAILQIEQENTCSIKKEIPAQMLFCEFWEISHKTFLKNPSDGCFFINTRSVYFPTTTLYLFKNDVTRIFRLSIFLA